VTAPVAPTSPAQAAGAPQWRSRITGSGTEDARALVANPRNWRRHPKHQADALTGMLDQVGWVQQVIVNSRTGLLVDGHLRVELAVRHGETDVPVVYVDLTEQEEALVLASLDPLAALATKDDAAFRALLESVSIDDNALLVMLDRLAPGALKPRVDPDDVPPVPTEPYVKAGELWLLGDHRLLCGDATSPEDVERLLDGATPRLLVTDPPYGVQLDPTWRDGIYNVKGRLGAKAYVGAKPYMQKEGAVGGRTDGHQNTTLSGDTIVDWSRAYALVPSIEVAYVWHAGVYASKVAIGLQSLGFEIRSQIIWAKSHFAMSRGPYHWQHEPCWFAVRKGKTAKWLGRHDLSTVWELASPKMIMGGSHETKEDHPAQKPIECMARPIHNHEGDVYEPFIGSGTTLMAAEREGRRCFGVEVEPRYVQVTIERWQAFTGREATRG